MFVPPRCPDASCSAHLEPPPDFYQCRGSYQPKCRPRPVPRFSCKVCGRGFSRQTFRADYCDNKPHLNAPLFALLTSGIGLRQCGRVLPLSRRCTERKARKISRHLRSLHGNLMGEFADGCRFQLDELETYEGKRSTRPLTVPILIESEAMFLVDARSAPIPPSGKMTEQRRRAIEDERQRSGPRENGSSRCVAEVLACAASRSGRLRSVPVTSDEKSTYPGLLRGAFGSDRLRHERVPSTRLRDTSNPLFRINLTEAMARDLNGRLRRRSWLVSKQREYLDLQLAMYVAYRNYARPRFNRDAETPAQMLGFVRDRLRNEQLLSWRQDWGSHSVHPISDGRATVADLRPEPRTAA